MTHRMKLQPEPFSMIGSGRKTIELRLYDEKRRAIAVGDEVVFSQVDSGEELRCRVVSLHPFPSFSALYASLPLLACGYTEEDVKGASAADMARYYSREDEERYGVLGIGITLL